MPRFEYDLEDSFRVTRNITAEDRAQFDELNTLKPVYENYGLDNVKMKPSIVSVDVVRGNEIHDLIIKHPTLTVERFDVAFEALKDSRAETFDQRRELDLKDELGVYEEGAVDLSLGIPLGSEGTDFVNDERAAVSRIISRLVGGVVDLPELEEPYLLVARARIGNDDSLDLLADDIEGALWPEYVEGEAYVSPLSQSVEVYDAEVHTAKVLTLPR